MADFSYIQSQLNMACADFKEQIQDNFGKSISSEILENMINILGETIQVEEIEKPQTLLQIERNLLEARSII